MNDINSQPAKSQDASLRKLTVGVLLSLVAHVLFAFSDLEKWGFIFTLGFVILMIISTAYSITHFYIWLKKNNLPVFLAITGLFHPVVLFLTFIVLYWHKYRQNNITT